MLKQINEEDMKKSNDYINNQEEIKKILNKNQKKIREKITVIKGK